MAQKIKAMRETARTNYIDIIARALREMGEDVGMSASNEINVPIVLPDMTEDWIVIKVSVPTGSRDGDAYDGYAMRDEYAQKCADKAEKAKAAAEAKAKKAARDAKMREQKAAAKAAREAQ